LVSSSKYLTSPAPLGGRYFFSFLAMLYHQIIINELVTITEHDLSSSLFIVWQKLEH
jgi:hypothetical protein